MNTNLIAKLLKENKITSCYFKGVYPSDRTPKPKINGCRSFYVFNLDSSDKPGSHWVCIMLHPTKNIYFDSYGFPPHLETLKNFMQNNYIFNCTPLQHPLSTVCGQWCLYFVYQMSQHVPINEVFKQFVNSPPYFLENDYKVNTFVRDIFGIELDVINKTFLKSQLER